MDISVARCFDTHEILPAVENCFYDIVEQGTSFHAAEEYVNVHRDCWLKVGGYGFVNLSPYNANLLEIHPFILKQCRNHSGLAVGAAIDWFDEHAPEQYTSLITNIPACKRYATLFAHRMGFKRVGSFSNGFKQDGKYHDMLLFQRMRVK